MHCDIRSTERPPVRRGAYSLLELLLVLVVILIVAMLSFPSLRAAMAQYRIEQIASRWSSVVREMRLRAMETGLPHAVTYAPNTVHYSIWSVGPDGVRLEQGRFRLSDSSGDVELAFLSCNDSGVDRRSKLEEIQNGASRFGGSARHGSDRSIVFRADGTASEDHCVWIWDSNLSRGVRIDIQALTGTISSHNSP